MPTTQTESANAKGQVHGGVTRLWLDDVRDPAKHGAVGWAWAKTYQEAITILETHRVVRASLDHDLTAHQALGMDDGEPTGYDVLVWMDENQCWPENGVSVHSDNPTGRAKMETLIRRRAV